LQIISKHHVIELLSSAFSESEMTQSILRSSKRNHFYNLFNFVFIYASQVGKIFVSEKRTNVLVYFQKSKQRFNIKSLAALSKFLLYSFSWNRIFESWKIFRNISKSREQIAKENGDRDYIYVWFLAKGEETKGYAGLHEIMNHLKDASIKNQLPIYLETTNQRAIPVYRRAGFQFVCDKVIGDHRVWFGKYDFESRLYGMPECRAKAYRF